MTPATARRPQASSGACSLHLIRKARLPERNGITQFQGA